IDARLALGDAGGLDDYAAWARTLEPRLMKDGNNRGHLGPLLAHSDHPSVAAAAEWLVNDPKAPGVPLLRPPADAYPAPEVLELVRPDALRVAGFRKAVERHLSSTRPVGTAKWQASGHVEMEVSGLPGRSYNRADPARIPNAAGEGTVRVCDYFAWL